MDIEAELNLILAGDAESLRQNLPLLLAVAQIVKHYSSQDSLDLDRLVRRKTKPKVKLVFIENIKKNKQVKIDPVVGEVSFRLMDQTSQTITEMYIKNLAQKIKTKFGGKTPFVWHKGKRLFSYTDWDNGYQFQILCNKKESGKALVEQVLDLRGKSPDWEYGNYITCDAEAKKYPRKPEHEIVLQKSRTIQEKRPVVDVEFAYATLHLYGLNRPITLYDRTGLRNDLIL